MTRRLTTHLTIIRFVLLGSYYESCDHTIVQPYDHHHTVNAMFATPRHIRHTSLVITALQTLGSLRQGLQALHELARPQDAGATDEDVLTKRLRHVMGEPQLAVREAADEKDEDP